MKLYQLSIRYLRYNILSFLLNVSLITLGVAIIVIVTTLQNSSDQQLKKNLKGIDLVIGAKGSPLQLTLSNVYHIDHPTGNIKISELEKIEKHPSVKQSIRLAYGDTYKGFRILGTSQAYINHYGGQLSMGKQFTKAMEVVLGNKVATTLGLTVGDHFHGLHGEIEQHGHVHEGHSYQIVGVLQPSHTVIDQLIITPIASVWEVHGEEDSQANTEVTAALLSFKGGAGLVTIPKLINKFTPSLQTSNPALQIQMLSQKLSAGYLLMQYIAIIIGVVSLLSILISMFNAMKDRNTDIAIYRSLGARPFQILQIIGVEILMTLITGILLGYLSGKIISVILSNTILSNYYLNPSWSIDSRTLLFVLGILVAGLLSGIIPALKVYKINISKTLSHA